MRHPIPTRRLASLLAGLGAVASTLVGPSAHADNLYWDGSGTNWFTTSSWSTDSTATTPDPLATPTIADNVFFNITGVVADQTITLNGTGNPVPTANSFTFNTTGTVFFGGGGNRDVAIGAGGITLNSGAGAVTFGSTTNGSNAYARVTANQTWTNNSASQLRMVNAASATATGTTPVTLTIRNTSSGNTTFSNSLNNGAGGAVLSLVVDSSGDGLVNMGGGTFSGGLTIQNGKVASNSTGVGAGAINLAAATGNIATMRLNTASAVTNNIVAVANGGVNVLEFVGSSGTLNGNILLTGDLNIGVRQSGATGATINGVISGAGDLIKGQYQEGNSQRLTLAGANTYTGDTVINNGAFTLADTGSLTFKIGADTIANRVTGTSSGAVVFAGTFNFDLTGAALADDNSWLVVDRISLSNTSFASTFNVQNFSETIPDSGVWSFGGFTFTESSGLLTYTAIPEPSAAALLVGFGVLALATTRRRRRAA